MVASTFLPVSATPLKCMDFPSDFHRLNQEELADLSEMILMELINGRAGEIGLCLPFWQNIDDHVYCVRVEPPVSGHFPCLVQLQLKDRLGTHRMDLLNFQPLYPKSGKGFGLNPVE